MFTVQTVNEWIGVISDTGSHWITLYKHQFDLMNSYATAVSSPRRNNRDARLYSPRPFEPFKDVLIAPCVSGIACLSLSARCSDCFSCQTKWFESPVHSNQFRYIEPIRPVTGVCWDGGGVPGLHPVDDELLCEGEVVFSELSYLNWQAACAAIWLNTHTRPC